MHTKARQAAVIATYKSKSNPKARPHEVRISRIDGAIYCSCKGWQFNKTCTHLKQFFADLDDPQMTEHIHIDKDEHRIRCNCTEAMFSDDICDHIRAFVDSLPEA